MIGDEILDAPGILGFDHAGVVAAGDQFAQHAAQEVGVAVVPAGAEGVGGVDDVHARSLTPTLARRAREQEAIFSTV